MSKAERQGTDKPEKKLDIDGAISELRREARRKREINDLLFRVVEAFREQEENPGLYPGQSYVNHKWTAMWRRAGCPEGEDFQRWKRESERELPRLYEEAESLGLEFHPLIAKILPAQAQMNDRES